MAFAPNGVLYVNTWSGRYYRNDKPPAGGFLVALKDTKGDGHADVIERFGDGVAQGSAGGTGIAFYNGALYAEQNDKIIRYPLPAAAVAPHEQPQVILSGLPLTGDHPMHPFIDRSAKATCTSISARRPIRARWKTASPIRPAISRAPKLETRAGTWRYDANKKDQHFSPAERYATGLRNGEGFAFDSAGRLFVTQHGRDQLSQNWPKLLYRRAKRRAAGRGDRASCKQGADYGWPECYYDRLQNKLVLAPEYGGDGGKKVGVCAEKTAPVAAFPGHWAPNDLLIYSGNAFPAAYRGGAFVAFHGSWNRAPEPQGGYNVVFQPLADGKASATFVVFADGFAGAVKEPGQAAFRPSGLAMGPDGALYISEDMHGRIWRVTYHGDARCADHAAAPAPKVAGIELRRARTAGGHASRRRAAGVGFAARAARRNQRTRSRLGDRIFHGEVDGGTCTGCHGSDAQG